MSVLPLAALPAGFTLEPATGAHVTEVFELAVAEETAAYGFCPQTQEDVRSILELPATAASFEHVVRDEDGAVVQWWVAFRDAGDPTTYAWVSTHPRLPDAVSDDLAEAGWAAVLDWIRAHPPEGGNSDIRVHSGCPAGCAANPRHLAQAGFTRQRTFWEMLGPVTDETRTTPAVPGLMIEKSRDVAAIHGVVNQAFIGHYGFTPTGLEDWVAVDESMPGFDPELRYLATVDGKPVAVMLLSRRAETEGAMYVGVLATLEQFRRRGIASALLAHAFDIAGREGLRQLSLHVDSENAHAAPAVYRRAGLEVRTAFWAYAQTLTH